MPRLDSLTSLRWFAASMVFVAHATSLLAGTEWEGRLGALSRSGAAGVGFFFILSGFVLAWGHVRAPAREFFRRRFARVVPAYTVAAVLGILWDLAQYGDEGIWRGLFTLTLLQSWVPGDQDWNYAGNSVGWSLSTELFFYALFPLLIGPVAGLDRRRLFGLLALVVAISIGCQFALRHTNSDLASWAVYIAPPYRLLEFVAGMCLARLLLGGVRLRVPVAAAMLLAIAVLPLAAFYAPGLMGTVAFPIIPFCLLIFVVAQADLEGRATGLRRAWLVRLGGWSYGFYLIHQLVTRTFPYFRDDVGDTWGLLALYVAAYACATLGAYLLFTVVERPLERLIRRDRNAGAPAGVKSLEPATVAARG